MCMHPRMHMDTYSGLDAESCWSIEGLFPILVSYMSQLHSNFLFFVICRLSHEQVFVWAMLLFVGGIPIHTDGQTSP